MTILDPAILADLALSRTSGNVDNDLGNCITLIDRLIERDLFDWDLRVRWARLQWTADPPRRNADDELPLSVDAVRIVAMLQLADPAMRRLTDAMMRKSLLEHWRRGLRERRS